MELTSETVQGAALAFQCVDDVHGGDGLSLGVFSVCDGITNDVFQEHLQDTSGFLVDQAGDTLDSTATGQTTDCWLRDSLDVIAQDFAMTLCSSFAQAFSSFASSSHVDLLLLRFKFLLCELYSVSLETRMMPMLAKRTAFIAAAARTHSRSKSLSRLSALSTLTNRLDILATFCLAVSVVESHKLIKADVGHSTAINSNRVLPLKKAEKNRLELRLPATPP